MVGRPDASYKQDIQLQGHGIAAEHCAFYMKNGVVCVAPCKDAHTWVNGKLIQGETPLHHGDRIALGINHYFRLNCPLEGGGETTTTPTTSLVSPGGLKSSKSANSDTEFNIAQEEVLLNNNHSIKKISNKMSSIGSQETELSSNAAAAAADDESKSIISSHSSGSNTMDENGLVLEMAIQKLEQDFSSGCMTRSVSSMNSLTIGRSGDEAAAAATAVHFQKGLKRLRAKLLRTNSLVREANSLCKEMNRAIRFGVTLQIPAYNLTPNRDVICFAIYNL